VSHAILTEVAGTLCIFVVLYPLMKIFPKAGFSPLLAILMFIPIVNVAIIYYLAFTKWPNSK
jgi:hypothetical protein